MQNVELFTRYGKTAQLPNCTDNKGHPLWAHEGACSRCGGEGRSERWRHTGLTCYDCGGSGKGTIVKDRLYTAAEVARLEGAASKRAAKRAEKLAEKKAAQDSEAAQNREVFERDNAEILSWLRSKHDAFDFLVSMAKQANECASLSPGQLDALHRIKAKEEAQAKQRAASAHVGSVGQRIEAKVTVERVREFQRKAYGSSFDEIVYIVTMRDEAGNCFVSMSPSFVADEGKSLAIRATVKEHDAFRGERQTKLQRIKLVASSQPAAQAVS